MKFNPAKTDAQNFFMNFYKREMLRPRPLNFKSNKDIYDAAKNFLLSKNNTKIKP
jgi:hypothetical protein